MLVLMLLWFRDGYGPSAVFYDESLDSVGDGVLAADVTGNFTLLPEVS